MEDSVAYTIETFKQDSLAINAAKAELNCLVLGEGTQRCAVWDAEYARIAQYFGDPKVFIDTEQGLLRYGPAVKRMARMFHVICTADKISGFDCNIYSATLDEISKKLKSMCVFRRRAKIKCFAPTEHRQPCYCARAAAVKSAAEIANSPVSPDMQAELQAKVSGALVLDHQLKREEGNL